MIKFREIEGKFYVFDERETQVLGVDNSDYANSKNDEAVKYVGKIYKTEKKSKRAVSYYSNN